VLVVASHVMEVGASHITSPIPSHTAIIHIEVFHAIFHAEAEFQVQYTSTVIGTLVSISCGNGIPTETLSLAFEAISFSILPTPIS